TALYATNLPMLVQGAMFFGGVSTVLFLIGRPFDAFSTFVIEELFDFNEQTPRLFIRDTLISLATGGLIAGILGVAILWVIESFPRYWAIGGAAIFLGFMVVFQVIYPRVIAPLFNDFESIDSGDVRDAVDDVFGKAGFECEEVYEVDASRRSTKTNAYFVGFGRSKRVVLYDTLLERMNLEEVKAVLAHELAHWQKNHVWKLIAASVIQVGIVLAIAQYLMASGWLSEMFVFPPGATYGRLFLALLWIHPVMQFSAPIQNKLSLHHEREADDFGASVVGVDPMVSSLQTLGGENLANPFPHPLYELFNYDHPPIPQRIRRLEEKRGEELQGKITGPD
ncbi:MAG: M48 family metallopeptidase, partial [Halobacteriaceae archaeon]